MVAAAMAQCHVPAPVWGLPDRDGPVCGSDCNVYSNTCQMKMKTCGQNVVSADLRHCQTTEHCNDKCFRIRWGQYSAHLNLHLILIISANSHVDLMANCTIMVVR